MRPPPPSVPTYRLQNPAESVVLQEDPSLSSVNLDCVPEKSENPDAVNLASEPEKLENRDAVNLACEPEKLQNMDAVNLVCETEKSENPDSVNLVCEPEKSGNPGAVNLDLEPEKSENPDAVKLDCETEKLENLDCVKDLAGETVKKPVVTVTFLNSQKSNSGPISSFWQEVLGLGLTPPTVYTNTLISPLTRRTRGILLKLGPCSPQI